MQADAIIEDLKIIPEEWKLTPVGNNKVPIGYNWQLNPFNKYQLIEAFIKGYCMVYNKYQKLVPAIACGYGLLTGNMSTYCLLAVDIDGKSAYRELINLTGGKLPRTVEFTSNRPGRSQQLFLVPIEKAENISSKRIPCAPGEFLELRWKGMQSVLPPSPHPITGRYTWKNSPRDVEVAIAPEELIATATCKSTRARQIDRYPSTQKTVSAAKKQEAIALLMQINATAADDYHLWTRTGMALKSVSPDLLHFWDSWSQQSSKWKLGECAYKWDSFGNIHSLTVGTLYWLAKNYPHG